MSPKAIPKKKDPPVPKKGYRIKKGSNVMFNGIPLYEDRPARLTDEEAAKLAPYIEGPWPEEAKPEGKEGDNEDKEDPDPVSTSDTFPEGVEETADAKKDEEKVTDKGLDGPPADKMIDKDQATTK